MQTVATTFTDEVAEYLRAHFSITLSTSSFTGLPHANTGQYIDSGPHIYFFAREHSVLLENLDCNHRVAFTVDDYSPVWQKTRELHGIGTCRPADATEERAASALAAAKFGDRPSGVLCRIDPSSMYFVEY